MMSHGCFKSLVAVIGMAVTASIGATTVSSVVASSTVASKAYVALAQPATTLHQGDTVVGALAVTQPMHIVISLKLRNQAQLKSFLAKSQQPGTPIAQRTMSSADFAAQFAPTSEQAQAVASYLAMQGFRNVSIAPNRQLVSADATADTVRAAFHTGFVHVQTHDGRDAYASTGGVMIPAALKDSVLSVLGLQTVHVFRTSVRPAGQNAVYTTSVAGFAGFSPTEFATIYGGAGVPTASTIPVGIIAEGSMTNVLSDLRAFTTYYNLPAVPTQVVGTGGTDVTDDSEWDLDSQDIVGMSGGVQKLIFYTATSMKDSDLTIAINAAVTANAVKIINVSFGECETDAQADGEAAIDDQIFEQAVAQGQTFSVSAGDKGANECGASTPPNYVSSQQYPASSPYVVAVGGTVVSVFGSAIGWIYDFEEVWNNSSTQATGGGPSTFEPMPSWQVAVGQNAGPTRGVPDVAFNAIPSSGAVIILHGKQAQYGGTSLSAPLFAGAWARTLSVMGNGFGFAAPLLYQLPASAFHDITVGNNNGESAAVGWDYCSGFGSLNMSQEIQDFGAPVAKFKYVVTGPTASFTDTSTDWGGTLSTHSWSFGDGGTSTTINPSHTYPAAGTYVVTETVTDRVSGKSGFMTEQVFTVGSPPVANFSYSFIPYNTSVNFIDTSTYPNGSSYASETWNFGDGSTDVVFGPNGVVAHTYMTGGTFNVTETVTVNVFQSEDSLPIALSASVTHSFTLMPNTGPGLSVPASSNDSSYTVNWTGVPGATSYALQQQLSGHSWQTVQNSTATSWLSTSALGPAVSGTYSYQVQACNSAGCGPWSPVGAIAVRLGAMAPVPSVAPALKLPATSSTGSYIVVWGSVPSATSYKLQQRANGGSWTNVGHALSNSLAVGKRPSGTYAYRAQACNVSGCGPWSVGGTIVVTTP